MSRAKSRDRGGNKKMRFIFNNPNFKLVRRRLRKQMTEAELLFWSKIKNKQLYAYKFRRQYGIGPFIVDFYCPKLKLVIEIDGGQHAKLENIDYDKSRTAYFQSMDIKVIRYWNHEVMNNIDGVYLDLQGQIKKRIKELHFI